MSENRNNLKTRLDDAIEAYIASAQSGSSLRVYRRSDPLSKKTGVVLCGAGELGRRTLAGLRRLGIEPLCFADNNRQLWDGFVDGLIVRRVSDAAENLGANAAFVVTVFNGSAMRRQLAGFNCRSILHISELYRAYPAEFLPFGGLAHPEDVASHLGDMQSALSLWSDDASREEYLAQIEWRAAPLKYQLPLQLPAAEIYFPNDLVAPLAEEVFLDCGAFDGDSIRQFLTRARGYRAVIGLEPDPDNFARLVKFRASLDGNAGSRFFVHQCAAGSVSGTVHFHATASPGSAVSSAGTLEMQCVRIDDLVARNEGVAPTFIKMDIEGAEQDALAGACETIAQHQPVLAVCLYHKPDDLWKIPLLMRSLNPGYKLFLRRYAEECWEIVCYAVPVGRLCDGALAACS